jgi:hypothetical protein
LVFITQLITDLFASITYFLLLIVRLFLLLFILPLSLSSAIFPVLCRLIAPSPL